MSSTLGEKLSGAGQQHLLRFWNELSDADQQTLAGEIEPIDFDQIARLHAGELAGEDWAALAGRAEPPPAFRLDARGNRFTAAEARSRGMQALQAGEVGAVLVAGGQGTRLGFDHPKGMFPIGPVSQATIFQILFEKLIAVGRRYGAAIPLYLMTSPATDAETRDFLVSTERFGLPADDLRVFCQGTMPAIDAQTGKLLLAEKGRLALSPDGHGGTLRALQRSGSLSDMRGRGLKQLFYFQVDNPLVAMCDPEFMGYHLLAGAEMSTQVVAKRTPRDSVGNVVSIDGRMRIIEYSDLNPLPVDAVTRTDRLGQAVFWAGNVAVHAFDLAFLDRMASQPESLPFHVAKKKVPYIDDTGNQIEPDQPNAKKFERFIFDLLPAAREALVMEVDERRVFAPVKNASGAERDSPETVRSQMSDLHREWLQQAGAEVPANVNVEISPLFALDAEELARRIMRGMKLQSATYLH